MTSDYAKILPIAHAIAADRQTFKRHYGVHPYFTRRPANVVRSYLEHYSRPGDRVLDPFGGSGVTAIEAFLCGRHAIHNDINPLGNFIASQLADVSVRDTSYIRQALGEIDHLCGDLVRKIPSMTEKEVAAALERAELPRNIELPRSSDVSKFYDLFTPRQLLALSVLKSAIDSLRDVAARGQLLLAWSATLAKLNKTFLSAKGRAESRGGSSIFSIYRYKVARAPVHLLPWETFQERTVNVIKAKEEILKEIRYAEARGEFWGKFEFHSEDILTLPGKLSPADYIFTDPPYGGHIAYLDLSTIWNHWLGFELSDDTRSSEIIVGGDLNKSEEQYLGKLRDGIKACFRLLKPNRWISVVFQHWNIAYFEAILDTAAQCGGGLRSAVTQAGDTVWSMHKKKGLKRVLSGEMILTFFKTGKAQRRRPARNHVEIADLVDAVLPSVAESALRVRGEALFNHLIAEAWRRNALHSLRVSRDEFIRLLEIRGWRYDVKDHSWVKSALGLQRELRFS